MTGPALAVALRRKASRHRDRVRSSGAADREQRLAQLAKLQPNSRETHTLVGAVLGLMATEREQQE